MNSTSGGGGKDKEQGSNGVMQQALGNAMMNYIVENGGKDVVGSGQNGTNSEAGSLIQISNHGVSYKGVK